MFWDDGSKDTKPSYGVLARVSYKSCGDKELGQGPKTRLGHWFTFVLAEHRELDDEQADLSIVALEIDVLEAANFYSSMTPDRTADRK